MRRPTVILVALAAAAAAYYAWRTWGPGDEQQIRRRLNAFAAEFNEGTTDGLGNVARAARLGSYFTDDIVVDLGHGSPPIQGRETLIGMAARLQPRTSAFRLELVDINVTPGQDSTAHVGLTAAFRRRSFGTGDESVDAREFALKMVKSGGEWRVDKVTAVDTFR